MKLPQPLMIACAVALTVLFLNAGARQALSQPFPGEESEFLLNGRSVEDVLGRYERDDARQRLANFNAAREKFLTAESCLIIADGRERLNWEVIDGTFEASVCLFRLFALLDGTERIDRIMADSGLILVFATTATFESISGRPAVKIEDALYTQESYELPYEFLGRMPFRNVAGFWESFLTYSLTFTVNRNEQGVINGAGVSKQSIWRL